MTVILGEGIEDRVELLLFLRLVFPVAVHGQAEGVFPLVPVGDLDALEVLQREHVFFLLVGRFPGQIAGQVAVFVFQVEAFLVVGSHELVS